MLATGCILGPKAYFKDGWNMLDGVLVIFSLINVLIELVISGGTT